MSSTPKRSSVGTTASKSPVPVANDDGESPVKRARGRPKKESPVVAESTPETTKGRGRPKKLIDTPAAGGDADKTPVRNIDSVETRGRGRPKKLTDTPSEEEDKSETTKGRGRQRKDKMEESASEEKNNDVSSDKKGRGRPRKSIGEGHLEESAATSNSGDQKEEINEQGSNVEISSPQPGLVVVKIEPEDTFHMSTRVKKGFSCSDCGQTFSVQYLLEDHERRCKKPETPVVSSKAKLDKIKQKAMNIKTETTTPKSKSSKEKVKDTLTPKRKPELKANILSKSKVVLQAKDSEKIAKDSEKQAKESEKIANESEKQAKESEQMLDENNDEAAYDKNRKAEDVEQGSKRKVDEPKMLSKQVTGKETVKTVVKTVKTPKDQGSVKKVIEKKLQLVVTPEGLKRTKEEKPAVLRVEKPRVSTYSRSLLVQRPTKPVEKKVVIVVGAKETEVSIEGTEDTDADGEDVIIETVESMKTTELECHEEMIDGKYGTDFAESDTSNKEEAEAEVIITAQGQGEMSSPDNIQEQNKEQDEDKMDEQCKDKTGEQYENKTGEQIENKTGEQYKNKAEEQDENRTGEQEQNKEKIEQEIMKVLESAVLGSTESMGTNEIQDEEVKTIVNDIEETLQKEPYGIENVEQEDDKQENREEVDEDMEGDDEDIVDEGALDGKRRQSDDETWTPKAKRRKKGALYTPANAGKGKNQAKSRKTPKNTISLLSVAAKKTLEKAKEENKELDPVQLKIFESLMSVQIKDDEDDEEEEDLDVKVIKKEIEDGDETGEENDDVAVILKDEEALVDISVIESMVDLESAECAICFMKFKNAKYMRNHLVTHTGNKKFTCEVCSKRFMRKYDLQQHMMRVHSFIKAARGKIISTEEELLSANNENIKKDCIYCDSQFTTQFMLDSHLEEIHSEERPFECIHCKARFPTLKKLIRHKDTVHSERQHQCEQCDKSFRFLYALKEHEKTHNEVKPFLCDDCGKGFALAKYLQKHKQRHNLPESLDKVYHCRYCEKVFDNLHEYQQHIRTHTEAEDRVHQCDQCPKRFFKYAHLKRHIMTHSTVRCYQCQFCEKNYKDPDTLRKHVRFIHKTAEEDANRKEYPCPFCDKVFYSNGHRKRHLIKHTGERPFKCDECGKGFTEKRSLQNHKRIHSGERPYSCKICGKAFIQLSHLNRHTFLHTQIRNFECDECGKKFFENADLQKHQRIHSKDKPYKCEFCGLGFSQPNILKCHRRRHTGEKPYVCDICNRAFIQMGALQTHRRLHTGERPFKCSYCGQGFVSKERMKFHTYIHTGITPHICHICGKGFRLKFKLQSHLDSHEGVYRYQCKICNKGFLEKTKLNRHIKQIHDDPTNPDHEGYIESNIRIIQRPETSVPKYQIVELHPEEDETTTHVIVEDDTLRNFSEIAVNSMTQPAANEEVIETTSDIQNVGVPSYEIQTSGAEGTNAVQHIQFDAESGEITTTGGTTLFDGTTTINLPEGIIYEGMENGEEVVYVVIPEDNQTVILS